MKAMVLAAGLGTRLLPLTLQLPKVLLPVQGKPLIAHTLLKLHQAGIKDVVINLHHLGYQIKSALGDGTAFGLRLHYSTETELLGSGGGIKHALHLLGDEPFLVISGDIWTDYPLDLLPPQLEGLGHLVLVDNPSWHKEGDFVLVQTQVQLGSDHRLTYGNFGVFSPQILDDWPQEKFCFGEVMHKAISKNSLTGEHYQGQWFNVGTLDELNELRTHLEKCAKY